jgi:hypothetical protein
MTHYLIIAFLASCLISLFYWQVVQPVLLRGLRFRLFARRDKLRRLAIENRENSKSFAYREVESIICKTIATIPARSLLSFFWFAIRNDDKKDENIERLRKEGSSDLLEMVYKTVGDALIIMSLNSPLMIFFGVWIVAILWIVGCVNRLLIYRKTENFIDELPDQLNNRDGTFQAA